MSAAMIQVGNTTRFEFEALDQDGAVVPLQLATTMDVIFQKADRTTQTHAGAHVTDGSDGKFDYTTLTADLDQDGVWYKQIHVITPALELWGPATKFIVRRNLI